MASGFSIRVTGTAQLLALDRRLRAAGNENLRQSMIRRLRYAGEQTARDLRREVLSLPIRGTGSTRTRRSPRTSQPLRPEIAAAIRVSVRTGTYPGCRIWVDKSRMGPGRRNLPFWTNEGSWRHPTYGRRGTGDWAVSYARPWWQPVLRANEGRMRAAAQQILDDVDRRLRG